jgi:DNA-binding response OmpR family regulator
MFMSKTILVIDDDKGLIKMLETSLSAQGYLVFSANTGEGGLQIAQNKVIDLILLDVILPGLKGRQVCVKLKENEKTRAIPVVFLTAKDSPDDVKAELAAGAIAHITKPIDLHELIAKLREVLPE